MEPISTAALAALILVSKSGTDELGKEAGRSTWAGLARLGQLVRGKIGDNGRATLAVAAARPHDEQAIARLRDEIEKCSATDPAFALELQHLVDQARMRPEYQPGSPLLANYGTIGKVTVFNEAIRLERGDFNIN
jgi:hypothetical protein